VTALVFAFWAGIAAERGAAGWAVLWTVLAIVWAAA
jgi:hypothetical protein